jgi:hypothetical protein
VLHWVLQFFNAAACPCIFCKTSHYFGGPSASPKGHLYPQMQVSTPPKSVQIWVGKNK